MIVNGLMQTKFGRIEGVVNLIDYDSIVNQNDGSIFFKAFVSLEETQLTNKQGLVVD